MSIAIEKIENLEKGERSKAERNSFFSLSQRLAFAHFGWSAFEWIICAHLFDFKQKRVGNRWLIRNEESPLIEHVNVKSCVINMEPYNHFNGRP